MSPPPSFLHFRHGAQARNGAVRRPRRLDAPRHRRRSGGRPPPREPVLRDGLALRRRSTAASSRSSPATPCWRRSACRRRTRTTRCAPPAPRSRCAQAVDELGLEARIGIEAGELVVEDSESTFATGEAVNLAARLQQAARPGEILVGPTAYRLAAGSLVVEDAGPLELKGIDGAAARLARRRHARRARPAARPARAARRPRRRARAAREHVRAHAFATGARTSSRSTASPESGRAASRASSSTASSARASSSGRALPYGEGVTYWPLGEMVKAAAGISDDDPLEEAFEKLRECCAEEAVADVLGPRRRDDGGARGRAQPAGDRVGRARGHGGHRGRPAARPPLRGHPLGRGAAARPDRAPRRLGSRAAPHPLPRAARAARRAPGLGRRPRALDGDRARAALGGGERGARREAARPARRCRGRAADLAAAGGARARRGQPALRRGDDPHARRERLGQRLAPTASRTRCRR